MARCSSYTNQPTMDSDPHKWRVGNWTSPLSRCFRFDFTPNYLVCLWSSRMQTGWRLVRFAIISCQLHQVQDHFHLSLPGWLPIIQLGMQDHSIPILSETAKIDKSSASRVSAEPIQWILLGNKAMVKPQTVEVVWFRPLGVVPKEGNYGSVLCCLPSTGCQPSSWFSDPIHQVRISFHFLVFNPYEIMKSWNNAKLRCGWKLHSRSYQTNSAKWWCVAN